MNYEIIAGDCLQTLKTLPANSVQTCITSPPYFNLRDYQTATWEGGDAACDHVERAAADVSKSNGLGKIPGYRDNLPATNAAFKSAERQYRDLCGKCGARRIDSQVGLESSPEAYVAKLVDVFREVRRVLHPTGVIWLNLGDSYATTPTGNMGTKSKLNGAYTSETYTKTIAEQYTKRTRPAIPDGIKAKDLYGIPWMVAFALRADGWWLRSAITWCKGSPMPESVLDRPTKATEMIFLLSKSQRYFYDNDAVRTKSGANLRDWWQVNTRPFPGAHFATFPPDLIEPCILAGTSAHGACSQCGSPWARVVEREAGAEWNTPKLQELAKTGKSTNGTGKSTLGASGGSKGWEQHGTKSTTLGWAATCACNADVKPCVVLDPFSGSGTTGAVALKHNRHYIGLELNESYIELAHKRIGQAQPLLPLEGAL